MLSQTVVRPRLFPHVYKWTNLNTADTNGDGVINTTDLHNVINGATTTPCTTQSGKEKNAVVCVANQIGVYANNGQSAIRQAKLLAVNPARLFAYDGTRMLGKYGATGVAVQETIWLGNLPVATLQNGAVYNIYPDQLGTPRVITNATNNEVWKWDSDPFGTTPANEDPSGSGTKFTYNLRFPGQYYDAETGKHYNTFRDYDPGIGRYVESDLLGLIGGMNTYGYVSDKPIEKLVPMGLLNVIAGFGGSFIPGAGGEGSSGVYLNPGLFGQNADVGVYTSGGMGGWNIGVNSYVGVIFSDASNVNSPFVNVNISAGIGSVTLMFDPKTGNWAGISFGPAAEVGGSVVYTDTGKFGLRDMYNLYKSKPENMCR